MAQRLSRSLGAAAYSVLSRRTDGPRAALHKPRAALLVSGAETRDRFSESEHAWSRWAAVGALGLVASVGGNPAQCAPSDLDRRIAVSDIRELQGRSEFELYHGDVCAANEVFRSTVSAIKAIPHSPGKTQLLATWHGCGDSLRAVAAHVDELGVHRYELRSALIVARPHLRCAAIVEARARD